MQAAQSNGPSFGCALITGASSGLGLEFVRQIAPFAQTLVLISRREAVLEEVAERTITDYPHLTVKVFASDLADASSREVLLRSLVAENLRPDLVVNNAGMGDYGEFRTSEWVKIEEMIRLNMEALTHLTYTFLPGLISEKGSIINVSSLASVLPIPDFAVYAATKAFVTSFSEALRLEMRSHGVRVLAVCPGPVKTEFGNRAKRSVGSKLPVQEAFYETPQTVVSDSLKALFEDRARVYPGVKVALTAGLIGLLPLAALRLIMSFRPRRSD